MKQWHISKAKYNQDLNAVEYTRVASFENERDCHAEFSAMANNGLAVNMYHENCTELSNPYFAMIDSPAYMDEERKIID